MSKVRRELVFFETIKIMKKNKKSPLNALYVLNEQYFIEVFLAKTVYGSFITDHHVD